MNLEEIRNLKNNPPEKPKKKYWLPKKSKKKIAQEKKERELWVNGESELVRWFKARMKMMTGKCAETNLATETKNYKFAISSICHILPKSTCKSVKYHSLNWIELHPDFHTKFDAMSWDEREKLGCWPIIQERLIFVYQDLHPSERRYFPQSVLNFINKHQAFPDYEQDH